MMSVRKKLIGPHGNPEVHGRSLKIYWKNCVLPLSIHSAPAFKTLLKSLSWWHKTLISALGKQKQADLCKLETSLLYIVSFKPARSLSKEGSSLFQERSKGSWEK